MRLRCASAASILGAASALLIFLILASPTLAAAPNFPALTGRVVDDAGILSASTQSQLTDMLAAHEGATAQQVVVVTLDSLQGYTIEDYGYQLGRTWGIGQKGKNTGAILIVAPKDHKVRIEVGYGLEGTLTDATSRTIIENDILPGFKRGDYNAGVLAGTTSLLKVLGGDTSVQPSAAESGTSADTNNSASAWPLLLFVAIWLVVIFLRRRMGPALGRRSYGYYGGGGFGAGGFGGGGSGGGFSGGGGSFGGGGASGSW
jgi:uncharacterized protein